MIYYTIRLKCNLEIKKDSKNLKDFMLLLYYK